MCTLTTHDFLPGPGDNVELAVIDVHCKNGRSCVTKRQSFAIIGNPVCARNSDTGSRTVVGKDNIVVEIHFCQIGKLAVVGLMAVYILKFQLFDHVAYPGRTERFPCAHFNTTRTKERPHCHFHGSGIRCRNNAANIIFR